MRGAGWGLMFIATPKNPPALQYYTQKLYQFVIPKCYSFTGNILDTVNYIINQSYKV